MMMERAPPKRVYKFEESRIRRLALMKMRSACLILFLMASDSHTNEVLDKNSISRISENVRWILEAH